MNKAKDTGSKDEQRQTTENIVYSLEKNPLKIPLVLDNLFKVVDYKTLKECRLVSSKWKDVGDPVFIERSVFAFKNTRENENKIPETMLKSPVKMKQLFESMKGDVKFTAFKFQHDLLTGPVEQMYFNPNKSEMTHLEIATVDCAANIKNWSNIDRWIVPHLKKLIVSSRMNIEAFAVSLEKLAGISHISLEQCKLIGSLPGEVKLAPKELILRQIYLQTTLEFVKIADFVGFRNLQVLHLDFSRCAKLQTPYLSFSCCANIKTLILIEMKIKLDGLISPRVLELRDNSYFLDGKESTYKSPCFISDYILEGTHLDKISLENYICVHNRNSVIFDFGHPIFVDEFTISGTRFKKTENNGGEIQIKDLTIRDPILMKIKDDEDRTSNFFGTTKPLPVFGPGWFGRNMREDIEMHGIDIHFLPSSLESLKIEMSGKKKSPIFSSSGDPYFPKLRQLKLLKCKGGGDEDDKNEFALFSKCPLLEDVSLVDFHGTPFSGNDDDFPALKSLVLWGVDNMTINNTNCFHPKIVNLDVLVISSSIFRDDQYERLSGCESTVRVPIFVFQAIAKFRAKLLVFFKTFERIDEETVTMLIRMKQAMNLQNLAFGPVEWKTDESFRNSLVFPIVETKSEYYLLEGDGIKPINEEQFMKMIPKNIDYYD